MSEYNEYEEEEYEHGEVCDEICEDEQTKSPSPLAYWSMIKSSHNRLWAQKHTFRDLLSLALCGSAIFFMAATFAGLFFHWVNLLGSLPEQPATSFLLSWTQAFEFWPLKLFAFLALPAIPFLMYSYLVVLEMGINSRQASEEEQGFFAKFPLHWTTFTTVPLLLSLSFGFAGLLKLFSFGPGFQWIASFPQYVLTACAFAIVFKSYSDRYASWKNVAMTALPLALVFEISKHAFIALSFWSFSAPAMASVFTLVNLAFLWNLSSAFLMAFGGAFVFVQTHWDSAEPESLEAPSSVGLMAMREASLIALGEATKHFLNPKTQAMGISSDELAECAQISEHRAQHVLDHLEDVGLVRQLSDKHGHQMAILVVSPDLLSLKEVVDAIEQRNTSTSENHEYAVWFWDQYCLALEESFADVSLRDLVEKRSQSLKSAA
jgi:DNA-binding IscR family transcriptional regulator